MKVPEEKRAPIWFSTAALLVSLAAAAAAFLPIALYTSPWNAVMFKVPDNEGNWWHFLIGAPFFLAFPMIWLHLRPLFSTRSSTPMGRRVLWIVVALSVSGTLLVTFPFVLRLGNLAQMHEGRWLSILCPTFGILIASGGFLYLRRREMPPTDACLVGLNAAYLANAAFCLVLYAPMPGTAGSRSGSITTLVIVWPMLLELVWIFARSFRNPGTGEQSKAVEVS